MEINFKQISDNSPAPILIIDNGIVIYSNQACLDLLKLEEKQEIEGQDFKKFLHPDFHKICEKNVYQILNEGCTVKFENQKLIQSDGEFVNVKVSASPIEIDGCVAIQASYIDISELKMVEEKLLQAEKLSVIGELAAGILHEIRNPLAAIIGFVEIMKKGLYRESYLDIIKNELNKIEEFANDLLHFSKPKKENFKPLKLSEIIKKVAFLFETEAFKRRITITHESDDIAIVLGDGVQLEQVLINLVKNAIEATPRSGEIQIKSRVIDQTVVVTVKDNGVGIPKDVLQKLGETFFTTKEKGTGLGLMITNNIIKHHNGEISVKSEVNIGTTFTILLPLKNHIAALTNESCF